MNGHIQQVAAQREFAELSQQGPPRLPTRAFGLPRCVNPTVSKTGSLLPISHLLCCCVLLVGGTCVKRQRQAAGNW
jgi:hypothetical protein